MKHHTSCIGLAFVASVALGVPAFAGDSGISFHRLGPGIAYGVTSDGLAVVGEDLDGGFLWTLADGVTAVGGQRLVATSDDRAAFLGDTTIKGQDTAAILQSGAWSPFGGFAAEGCGSSLSSAYDLAADGQFAVGLGWDGCSAGGFLWSASDGLLKLPQDGPHASRADTISADGRVIGGWDENEFGTRRATVWTQDPSSGIWMSNFVLASTSGNPSGAGEVSGSNGDGSILVGLAEGSTTASTGAWVSRDGEVEIIGLLPTAGFPVVGGLVDTSEDGSVMVGFQREGFGGGQSFAATIWTPETGLVDLRSHLQSLGVQIPENFELASAMSVSDDGRVICGWGYEGLFYFQESWIVVLPDVEPTCVGDVTGDGMVDGADIGLLLTSFGMAGGPADIDGNGEVDGADLGLFLAEASWGPCS